MSAMSLVSSSSAIASTSSSVSDSITVLTDSTTISPSTLSMSSLISNTPLPSTSMDCMDSNATNTTCVFPTTSTFDKKSPIICRYFLRGSCRFGSMCRYSHDLATGGNDIEIKTTDSLPIVEGPSTSAQSWANAPVFVPKSMPNNDNNENDLLNIVSRRSWAEVAAGALRYNGTLNATGPASLAELCPYEGPCPFGAYCCYSLHWELCEMCDQFCLHPKDEGQRRFHKKECLRQHEQAMELSFAIARSKDKTCGICFDNIMEKTGHEKRFGILPNCNHIFCLECIRKWRQAKQFEHKITRSCPECRVASDFVCPSAFWVETKEDKDKLLGDYRGALGIKDCKYFKKGEGKCPFGNKCFYKHALPNGEIVDVGGPRRSRRIYRSNDNVSNLLDIYLYEFLERRDLNFLEFLATSISDDSELSDVYD